MKNALAKQSRYLYSDAYKEAVFYFWYQNRELSAASFNVRIPKDENGQVVSLKGAEQWATGFGWYERAAALDLEASQKMDIQVIDERIKMFREHAQIGKEIKDFGLTYLRENGIKGDMAALRAIADGIQIERSSRGLADSLARLAELDDTKLLKEINKLLEVQQNVIDAEVEDITDTDEDSE